VLAKFVKSLLIGTRTYWERAGSRSRSPSPV
jgi:hypothetical protein